MKFMEEQSKTQKDSSKQSQPDHNARGHHPQSPSNFPKWEQCPRFENDGNTSSAATRGTYLHECFEKAVRKRWRIKQ